MKKISAVSILLLLAGCSGSERMQEKVRKPNFKPRKNAVLIIIRERSFPIGGPISNYLDRKFIGESRAKSYFAAAVKPGWHYVIAESEKIMAVRIRFRAGRIYYLNQNISSGAWDKNSALSILNRVEAEKSIKECEFIRYNRKKPGPYLDKTKYFQIIEEYGIKAKKEPDDYKVFLKYRGYRP